jgi:hypothetical protein
MRKESWVKVWVNASILDEMEATGTPHVPCAISGRPSVEMTDVVTVLRQQTPIIF